jgi:uncharacterized protein (TIGR01777 family)
MKILITGATGLVGRRFIAHARAEGHAITALSRDAVRGRQVLGEDPDVAVHAWPEPKSAPPPAAALRGADAVVHLLGEPIAQRWSDSVKQEIRDSRVRSTAQLVAGLAALPEAERPRVLVSQSATGYYGARDDTPLDENAAPGDDFLAGVVKEWEAEANAAGALGLRVALARTGVVLAGDAGALAKMLPPFKLGVGGPVAGGRQWVPWIHLDDNVGALVHLVTDERAEGPANLTAPAPATNAELSKALGRVLHRPALLPVPALALKVLYGEMASIVLTGARAVPKRLEALGYAFVHPELEPALRDVLS